MSYQVLARKYRPSSFSEVVGQEHVLKALENSIQQQKLHQAYIFSGTRGVGKTTIARVFAKCLNCLQAEEPQVIPCNKCSACEEIKIGRHIEFLEVDAASRTGVEDMRELLESVQYKPANARYKIYLIDEVHMLSKSSFNALLKTLEEPPPHVMFLMATTEIEKVPKTVLSRCLQLNLKTVPELQINNHLQSLLNLENIPFDEESTGLISDAAQGSVRDGLTLLDQAIAHGNGILEAATVKELLGTIDQSYLVDLVRQVSLRDGDAAYNVLQKITELNVEYEQVLKILISVFHKISLHQQISNSDNDAIVQLADQIDPQLVQLHYELALNSLAKFHVHPHPKEALELCIIRMLAFQPLNAAQQPALEKKNSKIVRAEVPSPKEIISEVIPLATPSDLSQTVAVKKADEPLALSEGESPHQKTEEVSAVSELDVRSWNALYDSLELSMFVREIFSEFEFVDWSHQVLTLRKSDELINPTEGLKSEFIEAISKHLGSKISLIIKEGSVEASPAATKEREAQEQLESDKTELLKNSSVQDILSSFDGKIIDSSIKRAEQ